MNKLFISILAVLFSVNVFGLTLTKMQITVNYNDNKKVDFTLDKNFKDFDIQTKLTGWKCSVENNLNSAKLTKNKFYADIDCSVNEHKFSQQFSCGEELVYQSFNLLDKNDLTRIQIECVK